MAHYNTVFSQLLKLIPRHEFETLAKQHHSGRSFRSAMVTVCNHGNGTIIRSQELARYG